MKRCLSCFKEFDDRLEMCPFCGEEYDDSPGLPTHLLPGTVLAGRYYIGKAVGSGGFGIIYKAFDMKLESVVAVKEFFIGRMMTRAAGEDTVIVSKKSRQEFEYRKRRFLAEARNMAKFGDSRFIPNVFEYFEANGTAYIVMELLEGETLNTYIADKGRIDMQFAIYIATEVGNALSALHEHKIVHRDVAPDNIFICSDKDKHVKLLDLGAAKLADSSDDVIDIILKPGYSPVEQYDSMENAGPCSDIYALGATLYYMLTGVKPDESTNRKINDTVVAPHELNPEVSDNLSNAVMKAMAVEKHLRFRNISEFLAAISGERKVVSLSTEKKRRRVKRFAGIAAAFAVLIIGAGAVTGAYLSGRSEQMLDDAVIRVWYSVEDDSTEGAAMKSITDDFTDKFGNVTVELTAIPESEYADRLEEAAKENALPDLFESSNLSDDVLKNAGSIDNVLSSEQAGKCLFIGENKDSISSSKKVPLGIEVPLACVITNGATSVKYDKESFSSVSDFGTDMIAVADDAEKLTEDNFGSAVYATENEFLDNEDNKCAVMLDTTMDINRIKNTITNYSKSFVYYDSDKIRCDYVYEWSIGNGSKAQVKAAERLLSWMLGNVYQSTLMISKCNDGQIPINETCFREKIKSKNLAYIESIYNKFEFKGEENN